MLDRPFVARPLENHPFLTLGDFFEGIRRFVWQNQGRHLSHLLSKIQGSPVTPGDIETLVLRYEKYGTLYHVISIEAGTKKNNWKFALSVAQFQEAREILDREFHLLGLLNQKFDYPYLPQAYLNDTLEIKKAKNTETFAIALTSWFEGYHEWHFQGDKNKAETAAIWNMKKGFQSASKEELSEIIRLSTKILTLYFDTETYHRIHPWHHGAGDFVVKKDLKDIDVRLITVRGYESLASYVHNDHLRSLEAVLLFFLDMTLKMRIDKHGGMGDPIWAADSVLPSLRNGFIEALQFKEQKRDLPAFQTSDVIRRLREFSKEDLYSKLAQLAAYYRYTDPVDFACIETHQKEHTTELHLTLQAL